jgi:hypothetical protein
LDSLEDFRKNPHVKIPLTNFQSLGIFKNQIVIWKRIFSSLSAQSAQRPAGPSGLSAQPRPIFFSFQPAAPPLSPLGLSLSAGPARPHGPAGRLLPPPKPEQCAQAVTTGRPRAAPWTAPTTSAGGKITTASLLLHSPLQSPVTDVFNPGALKLLQRQPLKAPGLPRLTSAL